MDNQLTKSQIDHLGHRLKEGKKTKEDIKLLDGYRRSFGKAYKAVIDIVKKLNLKPTGRPAKSTNSIIDKLQRESIRLTQIQDIAGCRIVLSDIIEQDKIIEALKFSFPESRVVDRRDKSSYGYRAVHIIPTINKFTIEIQIRTALQDKWSELSEKLADIFDPAIKYGGGPQNIREFLEDLTNTISRLESLEKKDLIKKIKDVELNKIKSNLENILNEFIDNVTK
jgi:putative GTP pyrophosphokinase